MAIQHRRGNFADFDPYKMRPGEWAFPLDRGEGYYCISPGDVRRVATKEEIIEILETNQQAYDGLQQLLTELEDETVLTGILADISQLLDDVAINKSNISQLLDDVAINKSNIETNTQDIVNLDDKVNSHLAKSVSDDVHGLAWSDYEKLTLLNGWTANTYLRVRINNALGLVFIYGEITPGMTDIGTTIATLPTKYRPGRVSTLPAQSMGIHTGAISGLAITTAGNINIYGSASNDIGANNVRINYIYRL